MGAPKKLLFLLLLFPFALCARAGGTEDANNCPTGQSQLRRLLVQGVLNGYVTDAVTKKPLPGVVVSAIVPGTNNLREVLTDADGYFRFVELPAVPVTVEFNKKGYQSAKRPNVAIKEKTSVKLNVEFLPDDDESPADAENPILHMLQSN